MLSEALHERHGQLALTEATLRVAQETVRAGQVLEITVWGDEPVIVEADQSPELEDMQDEESGNQWLYSCVVCGDGGDVAMCDAVRTHCAPAWLMRATLGICFSVRGVLEYNALLVQPQV